MEIVTVSELPRELTASWGTLVWSDNDAPQDRALFERARALGFPWADYGGLLAVDQGEVLAQVIVGRSLGPMPWGGDSAHVCCESSIDAKPRAATDSQCSGRAVRGARTVCTRS
jgi:hypothetical protein